MNPMIGLLTLWVVAIFSINAVRKNAFSTYHADQGTKAILIIAAIGSVAFLVLRWWVGWVG